MFYPLCFFSACENGWALFAGHCYYFNAVGTKWNQAEVFLYLMLIFIFPLAYTCTRNANMDARDI